jgi:mono/diheme cytochrome c family protein
MWRNASVVFITILFFSTLACKHDPDQNPDPDPDPDPPIVLCDPDTVYFQNDILPLLIQSCGVIGCHDPGTAQDGVVLTDYASVINTGDVRPGRPDNSEIYEKITDDDNDDRMPPPPYDRLKPEQIAMIRTWILQGALNNACEEECDDQLGSFSGEVWPTIQKHCLSCHSGSSPQGGISLSNHGQIAAMANNGGLLGAIKWQTGFSNMPLNGNKLSDCEITQIENWILDGTPQN